MDTLLMVLLLLAATTTLHCDGLSVTTTTTTTGQQQGRVRVVEVEVEAEGEGVQPTILLHLQCVHPRPPDLTRALPPDLKHVPSDLTHFPSDLSHNPAPDLNHSPSDLTHSSNNPSDLTHTTAPNLTLVPSNLTHFSSDLTHSPSDLSHNPAPDLTVPTASRHAPSEVALDPTSANSKPHHHHHHHEASVGGGLAPLSPPPPPPPPTSTQQEHTRGLPDTTNSSPSTNHSPSDPSPIPPDLTQTSRGTTRVHPTVDFSHGPPSPTHAPLGSTLPPPSPPPTLLNPAHSSPSATHMPLDPPPSSAIHTSSPEVTWAVEHLHPNIRAGVAGSRLRLWATPGPPSSPSSHLTTASSPPSPSSPSHITPPPPPPPPPSPSSYFTPPPPPPPPSPSSYFTPSPSVVPSYLTSSSPSPQPFHLASSSSSASPHSPSSPSSRLPLSRPSSPSSSDQPGAPPFTSPQVPLPRPSLTTPAGHSSSPHRLSSFSPPWHPSSHTPSPPLSSHTSFLKAPPVISSSPSPPPAAAAALPGVVAVLRCSAPDAATTTVAVTTDCGGDGDDSSSSSNKPRPQADVMVLCMNDEMLLPLQRQQQQQQQQVSQPPPQQPPESVGIPGAPREGERRSWRWHGDLNEKKEHPVQATNTPLPRHTTQHNNATAANVLSPPLPHYAFHLNNATAASTTNPLFPHHNNASAVQAMNQQVDDSDYIPFDDDSYIYDADSGREVDSDDETLSVAMATSDRVGVAGNDRVWSVDTTEAYFSPPGTTPQARHNTDEQLLRGGAWVHEDVRVGMDEGVRRVMAERELRRASRDLGINHYPRPESAPQLRYTPIEQTVSPGSPVSLKCSAMGSPSPVITWTRDHRPLMSSHRTSVGSFRTALGEIVSHVNLSDVTVREGGIYTCTAHNTHGSQSHSAPLNVYGPPFVRTMANVTSVAGEDVKLWCPAGGYPAPTVTWRRGGRPLPSSLRQEVLSNGTLVIRNAVNEDAGRYSCLVTGRQGQTAASHTFLHVLKPPSIEPFSFRANLHEGDRTQLTCMVNSGDLPITINWLKDGRHLQHDPDIDSKQIHEYSTVLLFTKLQEHHSGSYTCEAANAAATTNHTATVKVKVSPKWLVEPSGGTALVGSTVVLDCSARGHPKPVLTWMKAPGEAAQEFQPVVLDGVRLSQASNGSLILHNITPGSGGWYQCRAANGVGKPLSSVIQLTVHAPAHVVTEGGRVTGHSGQVVTVTCEATGDQPLTLAWQHHHTRITPGHRISVHESSVVGGVVRAVLEIRGVTAADAGSYTCLAANAHGEHSQVYTIAVIEPPTPPGRVEVTDVGSRSARVSWTLPQPAAVTIQYKAVKEESWSAHGRNVSVGQWAASHMLTGLTPHHTYMVRLMAHNDLGVSQPSSTHIFTTTEEAPSGAPRDVHVAAGGPHSLLVTWRAPPKRLTHGTLRGYTIALRRQNLQGHPTYITRPVTAVTDDGEVVEQYEVRGLTPATLYEVAVRAFTRAGPGPLSSPRIVDSTRHDAPSCPPASVSCRGSGRGSVRVWWSPPPSHCAHAPVSGYTVVATPTRHVHHISATGSSTWEVNTTNLEKNLDSLPPATNISVTVRAFNDVGSSTANTPVFCVTDDDAPGPPRQLQVIVTGARNLLVSWSPPHPYTGKILHYTLYSARDTQMAVRDVVDASGSEATWRELNGLTPASRVQVWVTASTAAGEGSQSPRLTAVPKPTPSHTPVAVGGGRVWHVGVGSGVTLGCRGLGTPTPTVSWYKDTSPIITAPLTQLLPGGDLHLTAVRDSANYTCVARNGVGEDRLMHQVLAVTTPSAPTLSLAQATHSTLNLTITSGSDGGVPILGYTVHHRGRAGEWVETSVDPGMRSVVVRGLACGAPHHLYLTAWNAHGTSPPSPVLVTNTLGSPPGRPDPSALVEVNATCVTLRLYVWPELGCPITHWKVERDTKESGKSWEPLYARVTPDKTDLGLCDLTSGSWHLVRVMAASTAGDTTAVYRVATKDNSGSFVAAESVQEVVMSGPVVGGGWLDAHVVAGVVSALLLAVALIICVCVAIRRQRYGGYRQGESMDQKGGSGEDDNARNSELTRATHLYSPTPTKKPRGSLASLKTQDDASDPYEICPYATFSVGSSEGTLEYGLSLHTLTPRDCLDHPDPPPHHHHSDRRTQQQQQQSSPSSYGQVGHQRSQSHYKETEIAYISNRNRGGEYGSRPKSMPGTQGGVENCPPPAGGPNDTRKDTHSRPHRSRSRSRGEATQRDSSTESNDASSPIQQRQHYQHPQLPPHYLQQIQPAQQQAAVAAAAAAAAAAGGRVAPHPLPPVRHAR